jgi:PhzF family phenazine biosynthesis protein
MTHPVSNIFQVITFATDLDKGNPAHVLVAPSTVSDQTLISIAQLLNADVMAVIDDPSAVEPSLRFFTPQGSHGGTGHASHAAAYIALREGITQRDAITFRLADGGVRVGRFEHNKVALDYLPMEFEPANRISDLAAALGAVPLEAWVSPFGYIAVYSNEAEVAALQPNLALVSGFDRAAIIATGPGVKSDFVVRVFAPNIGLPEDPVCGTAHRALGPYWAERLNRNQLHSRQISSRGGNLWCNLGEKLTVTILGSAATVLSGELRIPQL